MTGTKLFEHVKSILIDVFVSFFWTVAISIFAKPNQIAPTGFGGVTVILNYLFDLPIGLMTMVLNVPLLVICWRVIGHRFVLRTVRVIAIYTVLVDYVFVGLPVYEGDALLAALFGGVFNGIASGLVFMQGYSGGGTDLIIKMIRKKYPYVSTGELVMGINCVIMGCAALVYGNIEAALYGMIMSFTTGRVMDGLLNGADASKSVMIVTHNPQEISKMIIRNLMRSATILNGTGAFTGEDTYIVLCVVRKTEFFELKKMIREVDPTAFVIVNEANQILGKGFRSIEASDY